MPKSRQNKGKHDEDNQSDCKKYHDDQNQKSHNEKKTIHMRRIQL